MRIQRQLLTAAVATVVLTSGMNAKAALYLQYDGSAGTTTGVTLYYPWDNGSDGQSSPRSGIVFGLYNMSGWSSASGGTKTIPNWVSVCLSPGGTISGRESVLKENFGQASPGHLPNNWSQDGIYNTAYLYNTFVDSAAGNNDKGVGLALAMLDALYDSNGKGIMSGAGLTLGSFRATGMTSGALSWYNTYIAEVTTANINASKYYVGSVYRPIDNNGNEALNGQDFITKGVMVPEPTTVLAGALLLLPFAVSTIRFVRKNRTA